MVRWEEAITEGTSTSIIERKICSGGRRELGKHHLPCKTTITQKGPNSTLPFKNCPPPHKKVSQFDSNYSLLPLPSDDGVGQLANLMQIVQVASRPQLCAESETVITAESYSNPTPRIALFVRSFVRW